MLNATLRGRLQTPAPQCRASRSCSGCSHARAGVRAQECSTPSGFPARGAASRISPSRVQQPGWVLLRCQAGCRGGGCAGCAARRVHAVSLRQLCLRRVPRSRAGAGAPGLRLPGRVMAMWWSVLAGCSGGSRWRPTLRSRGADKESLAAGYSLLLLATVLPGRGHGPPTRPSRSLSGQQTANAPASGVSGAEPGPSSGVAGGEGDRAGSVSRWGVTVWPQQRWPGLAVPQALGLPAGRNMPFQEDKPGRAASVGAASPVCHLRAVRGGHAAGEGCSALGAEGWSLWGPFGPTQQPLCNAVPRAVGFSLPCPGAGCSLLLQFLTAICGQGSTRRDTKPVTSAPHS